MHYFLRKIYSSFLTWPYPFNTTANLQNLGTVLFLRAQGIQKSFYCLHILMFSFETWVCLRMVEVCKFSAFFRNKKQLHTTQYASIS